MTQQYLDLVNHVIDHGTFKEDRTGVGTLSYFGYQMRFDLQKGFPLLTTKKMGIKTIAKELLWFLRGERQLTSLVEQNVKIWDDNGFDRYLKTLIKEGKETIVIDNKEELLNDLITNPTDRILYEKGFKEKYDQGKSDYLNLIKEKAAENTPESIEWLETYADLGPIYGYQWRHWNDEYDQIKTLIHNLKTNPDSRRHIVSAWNVSSLEDMVLPPCHTFFQFYVVNEKLSCQLYQRSGDIMLGVPFNIASYALLVHIIAREVDLEVGEFVHTIGDAHIYDNHTVGAMEQIKRQPKPLPTLTFAKSAEGKTFEELDADDFILTNYTNHPRIDFTMAI